MKKYIFGSLYALPMSFILGSALFTYTATALPTHAATIDMYLNEDNDGDGIADLDFYPRANHFVSRGDGQPVKDYDAVQLLSTSNGSISKPEGNMVSNITFRRQSWVYPYDTWVRSHEPEEKALFERPETNNSNNNTIVITYTSNYKWAIGFDNGNSDYYYYPVAENFFGAVNGKTTPSNTTKRVWSDQIQTDTATSTYRIHRCGDGRIDSYASSYFSQFSNEQCDDGNTKDGDGCSKTCQKEEAPKVPKCVNITANPSTTTPGKDVSVTCNAENATKYKLEVIETSQSRTISSTQSSVSDSFSFIDPGTYTVKCTINDNVTSPACQTKVTINSENKPLSCDNVTAVPTTIKLPGGKTRITCKGTNASSYEFKIQKNGATIKDWTAGTPDYLDFSPTEVGAYDVICRVKNTKGETIECTQKPIVTAEKDYIPGACTEFTSSKQTLKKNETTTFTCKGTNVNRFTITVKKNNQTVFNDTKLNVTNGIASRDFTPVEAGEYTATCNVDDGQQSLLCTQKPIVTVQETDLPPVCLSFTATPIRAKVGEEITLSCNGQNATNYTIDLRKNNQSVSGFPKTINTQGGIQNVKFIPDTDGEYTAICTINGKQGQNPVICTEKPIVNIDKKDDPIKQPMCKSFSVTPIMAKVGQTLTLTCDGDNATEYLLELKKGTQTVFTKTIQTSGGPQSTTYTTTQSGVYTAICTVKGVTNTNPVMCTEKPIVQIDDIPDPDNKLPACLSFTANPIRAKAGETITLSCNGQNATSYNIEVKRGTTSVFTKTIQTAGGVQTTTFVPDTDGEYTAICTINGKQGQNPVMCTEKPIITIDKKDDPIKQPMCKSFSVTPISAKVGQTLTLTCDGDNATEYLLELKKGTQTVFTKTIQTAGGAQSTTYTTTQSGEYTAICTVKGVTNTNPVICSEKPLVTIEDLPDNNLPACLSFTASPLTAKAGDTINLSCNGQNATNYTIDVRKHNQSISGFPKTINTQGGEQTTNFVAPEAGEYTAICTINGKQGQNPVICTEKPLVTVSPKEQGTVTVTKTQSTGTIFTKDTIAVKVGDTLTYKIEVKNTSSTKVSNIYIDDTLPVGLEYLNNSIEPSSITVNVVKENNSTTLKTSTFSLDAGQAVTLLITTKVVQETPSRSYENRAYVYGISPEKKDSVTAVLQDNPNTGSVVLNVTKDIINPTTYAAGDEITFSIKFSNLGSVQAENVIIKDLLPSNLQYVSHTFVPTRTSTFTTGVENSSTRLEFGNITLAPGENGEVRITTKVQSGGCEGGGTNVVFLSASNASGIKTDTESYSCKAALALTKYQSVNNSGFTTSTVDITDSGAIISYRLDFANNGGQPTTGGVLLYDYLPNNVVVQSANITIPNVNRTTGTDNRGSYILFSGFNLQAGQQGSANITVKLSGNIATGAMITNLGVLKFLYPDREVTSQVTAVYNPTFQSGVGFDKSVINGYVKTGESIIFRLTLTNYGPETLSNIKLEDIRPERCVNFTGRSGNNISRVGNSYQRNGTTELVSGQNISLYLFGQIKNQTDCVGTWYNTGIATYTRGTGNFKMEDTVPFTVYIPNTGTLPACQNLDPLDGTIVRVGEDGKGEARFRCSTNSTGQKARITINCGNGKTYTTVDTYAEYRCPFDESVSGLPRQYNVTCDVENVTNGNCQETITVDRNVINMCGNGKREGIEQCDLGENMKVISGFLDNNGTPAGSQSNRGLVCNACTIRNNTGSFAYRAPACLRTNTSISIQVGEILPFRWDLDKNNSSIIDGNSCNGQKNVILEDSMKCLFAIYNGKSEKIISFRNISCNIDERKNQPLYRYFLNNPKLSAGRSFGKYIRQYVDTGLVKNIFGEYKLALETVSYNYCDNNGLQQIGIPVDRVCEVDFTVTRPYVMQKNTFSAIPKVTTEVNLNNFFDMFGKPIMDSTDIRDIMVVDESKYDGGVDVNNLMRDFIEKQKKLALTIDRSQIQSYLSNNPTITVSKVPNQQIYIFEGNGGSLKLKELSAFTKPFTMIVRNMDLVVEGSIDKTNGMFLVQNGKISFNEPATNRCARKQTVNGIFVTDKGFGVQNEGVTLNTDPSRERCNEGGLYVRGVLIGDKLEDLVKQRRSHLNDWFRVNSFNATAIRQERRNEIFSGASVTIEYSPLLWNALPPGAQEFTQVLDVYKK